jgi:hypothetical protein
MFDFCNSIDPKATSAAPNDNDLDVGSAILKYSFFCQDVACRLLGTDIRRREVFALLGGRSVGIPARFLGPIDKNAASNYRLSHCDDVEGGNHD